jgi:hypothetical protein
MPRLQVDFSGVPDEFVPTTPGRYKLNIESATMEETSKHDGSMKVLVSMRIIDEGPAKGRQIQDHISTKMLTTLKRIALSAGLSPGPQGYETEELIGRTVTADVSNEKERLTSEQVASGQEARVFARIKSYVIPDQK